MLFEWDVQKSEKTKLTRGVSFKEASLLWEDPTSIEVLARTTGEIRIAKIGILFEKVHICIFTYRADRIRIISVRRARKNEEIQYEKAEKDL